MKYAISKISSALAFTVATIMTIASVAVVAQAAPHIEARSESVIEKLSGEQSSGLTLSNESTSSEATAPREVLLSNGLNVTLYTADVMMSRLVKLGSQDIIMLDDHRYVNVITDINDPSIYNKGDGAFHAFSSAMVERALGDISFPSMQMDITVYVLPYPRRNLLVSSTSGFEVFLSPHVLDIDAAVGAYIIAHEIGHVFHNAYLPGDSPRWANYRRIRGITDESRYNDYAAHAYRPKEILAEDFRVFFGGELAAYNGNIENVELDTPTEVAGLNHFFMRLGGATVEETPTIMARNYPNPFNPDTEITISIPSEMTDGGQSVSVRIYDVRGKLIKELYHGQTDAEQLRLRWDGTNRFGQSVASAHYFAQVRVGSAHTTLKLVLLK